MFRRTPKSEADQATAQLQHQEQTDSPRSPGGKGRPTPSRKEAQAAARARARAPMDKKAARKVLSQNRAENGRKMREAMRTGDERYLPARDKGPVRRFVRTFVDSRLTLAEFLLPLLLLILIMGYTNNAKLVAISFSLQSIVLLLAIVDTAWLTFRLKRALRKEFPDGDTKGVTFYAITRALQLRFMRQPKTQVKIGGRPK